MPKLIEELPEGRLAIFGDVHGEIEALEKLMGRVDGLPGERCTPVFVGDLVDRGPDSLAVVRLVAKLIKERGARAVLGNHELNILQNAQKDGNGWFFGQEDHARVDDRKVDFEWGSISSSEQEEVRAVLGALPLVLQRNDLRVVHARWDAAEAHRLGEGGDFAQLAANFEADLRLQLSKSGVSDAARRERAEFDGLKGKRPDRHLASVAEEDFQLQSNNPVKLLTSGAEVRVVPGAHFFAGKWRFVKRRPWWEMETEIPTVIGHHWRLRGEPIAPGIHPEGDVPPFAWRNNVFCVDYSAGYRFFERVNDAPPFKGGLAALIWPDRKLVFDDREELIQTTDF